MFGTQQLHRFKKVFLGGICDFVFGRAGVLQISTSRLLSFMEEDSEFLDLFRFRLARESRVPANLSLRKLVISPCCALTSHSLETRKSSHANIFPIWSTHRLDVGPDMVDTSARHGQHFREERLYLRDINRVEFHPSPCGGHGRTYARPIRRSAFSRNQWNGDGKSCGSLWETTTFFLLAMLPSSCSSLLVRGYVATPVTGCGYTCHRVL